MKLFKVLSSILNNNIFVLDYWIKKENRKKNSRNKYWETQFTTIDSIQNYELFKNKVAAYKNADERCGFYSCYGQESLLYGHIHALYEYAGLHFKTPKYLPKIEHGINFYESNDIFKITPQPISYVFQGKYKIDLAYHNAVESPIICIGPYIHYCSAYYSRDSYEKIKAKNGKTLLVFPPHSFELSNTVYDASGFVNNVYKKYEDKYDTIMVCAYWLDLDDEVYDLFQKRGAVLVSAGVRFDPSFIRRLKTIIQLSDGVLVNDIGTNIGYSIYLGKEVFFADELSTTNLVDSYSSENESPYYNNTRIRFVNAIKTKNQREIQELYQLFWGGESLVKTPDEIRSFILSCRKYTLLSLGQAQIYKKAWKDKSHE